MNKVFLRALAKETSKLQLEVLDLDEAFEKKMVNLAFEQEPIVAKQLKTLKENIRTLSELRVKIDDEMHNVDEKFEKQFGDTKDTDINSAFSALIEGNQHSDDINAAFQDIISEFKDPIKTEDQNIINAAANFIAEMDSIEEQAQELNEVELMNKKIDLIQRQLGNWMSVGWGQAGMTYGSGEVRLEFLDDVDRETIKQDGYILQYQEETDKFVGVENIANPIVSGSTSGDTMELVMQDGSTIEIDIEHAEVYLLLEDGDKILMEDSGYLVQDQLVGNPLVSGLAIGDNLELTQHDGSTIDIDITQVGDPFILLEDGYKIDLENETGFLHADELFETVSGVISGAVSGNTLTLTKSDTSTITVDVSSLNREIVSGVASADTLTLTLDDDSTVDIDIETVGDIIILLEDGFKITLEDESGVVMGNTTDIPIVSGTAIGNELTLTHQDGSEVVVDVGSIRWDFLCHEDGTYIMLEAEEGFIRTNQVTEDKLQWLLDVDRESTMVDGNFVMWDADSQKYIGAVNTTASFDPSGYHYINDSKLKYIENETENKGLLIEDNVWTKITCNGFDQNKLPTGLHQGIAGTSYWVGSGSKTYSRIWDEDVSRFYFDELPLDTVVIFRVKIDSIPETNNTLIACRINFVSLQDGNDDPVLEDATIASEYYITLEDDSGDDIVNEDNTGGKFNLEIGVDMGQGDYPGSYDGSNYKVELETATDGGTGILVGDFFQRTNFQQTVSAQELSDGAGEEQERTFVFPIYVGDSNAQRGYGEFEVFASSEIVVNDTSILAALN